MKPRFTGVPVFVHPVKDMARARRGHDPDGNHPILHRKHRRSRRK
jgi:hypothetical protein